MSEKIQYLTDTHLHIFENIKLADQKALVLLALNPAILSKIAELIKDWVFRMGAVRISAVNVHLN